MWRLGWLGVGLRFGLGWPAYDAADFMVDDGKFCRLEMAGKKVLVNSTHNNMNRGRNRT